MLFVHQLPFFSLQSLSSYQNALENLGQRKCNAEIWDAVVWELSTALYNMAVLAQESPGPYMKVGLCPPILNAFGFQLIFYVTILI